MLGQVEVPGWRVEVVEQAASTNADVARRAREGEPEGLVIATGHQVAGRGRLDRAWVAPAGAALAFSALIRPTVPAHRWPWLPLVTGLAVARGIRRRTGLGGIVLKWPNDVLHLDAAGQPGKLCGILLERVESAAGPAAVIGVGINVAMSREQLPVPTATSLLLAGAQVDSEALLESVLIELDAGLQLWETDAESLYRAYVAECDTIGREVVVWLPDESRVAGVVSGVDVDGRLELETADGPLVVGAGDVVHVRPA